MEEINFQPLFEYLDDQFWEAHAGISSLEMKLDKLQNSLDDITDIAKNPGIK